MYIKHALVATEQKNRYHMMGCITPAILYNPTSKMYDNNQWNLIFVQNLLKIVALRA